LKKYPGNNPKHRGYKNPRNADKRLLIPGQEITFEQLPDKFSGLKNIVGHNDPGLEKPKLMTLVRPVNRDSLILGIHCRWFLSKRSF
jgi:hypothetical protein